MSRPGSTIRPRAGSAVAAVEVPLAAVSLYLAGMTLAAALRGRRCPVQLGALPRFVVLVPAHDEEAIVESCVRSLLALDYPAECFEVVVVADNCSDRTAAIARTAGARVLERHEPDRAGKGQALAWALDRVGHQGRAVMLVDADCEPSSNLLRAAAAHFAEGATVVQSDYVVSNPTESTAAALRYASFTLGNTVRANGASALGLSCGLLGTGMAFAPGVLERIPWRSFSLVEDREQHLRLVEAGERVDFCPEANVCSPMPASLASAGAQQLRWQAGRSELVRRWTPRLVRMGITERNAVKAHAALEQALPPMSLLGAFTVAAALLSVLTDSRMARRLAAVSAASQAAHVLGGLALARAPDAAWRALALVPAQAAHRAVAYARIASGDTPSSWQRTERATGEPTAA